MKRVAIITINSINFGNRLQNYALQEILKLLGFEAVTIRREKTLSSIKDKVVAVLKTYSRRLIGTRGGLYDRFNQKYIHFSEFYATANEYSKGITERFDYFIVGSDQVWNPYYADCGKKIVGRCDLLFFARNSQKISYAASFGITSLPQEKKELYASALKDFFALSVREEAGKKIIKELTGREAKIVLDPTLLLSSYNWYKVAHKPAHVKKKKNYTLVYLLGKDYQSIYDKLSYEEQKNVIDIMKKKKNGRFPMVGPSEFLYLVANADNVITDSFHATVFSVIFHKPVKTFPRDGIDMSSRILSLASKLGLENNFTEDGIFYINPDANYERIERKLEEERKDSINFLKNALK